MVTSFNDRIDDLTRKCARIVSRPIALQPSKDRWNITKDTSSRGMKRQAPSKFCNDAITMPDTELRRKKEKHNYSTSIFQQALGNTFQQALGNTSQQVLGNVSRPQVSFFMRQGRDSPSSVNSDCCTVITSAEHDASAEAAIMVNSTKAANFHDAQNNTVVDESMLAYAALIQSTREYYGFQVITVSDTPIEKSTNINEQGGANNGDDHDDNEEDELRTPSDATSTTSSQTIDYDNRSDGTSSNHHMSNNVII